MESKWTSNLGKYFKKAVPANQIKGLCMFYEGHKEWLFFLTFLLQLSDGKYHVSGGSMSLKSTLGFWIDSVCKHLESLQHKMSKQLPYNAEKRDATVVIAVTPSPLFLYNVMMFASFLSCGTPPSLQQRQNISYSLVVMISL